MRRVSVGLVLAFSMAVATSAHAATYHGKVRLVQSTATTGTLRFLTSGTSAISLFASSDDFKKVMLHALFTKVTMDLGYTVSACPPGISGTCGTVDSVSVDNP